MIVRLYDSLTRELHDVSPVDGETVKIYSCGPTVYRYIHIGNMRSFMLGDLIRRALRFEGSRVRWIMNITDVGHMTDEVSDTGRDKMELAEADEGLSAAEIATEVHGRVPAGRGPRWHRARRPVSARHRAHRGHDQGDPDPDREGPRVRGRRVRVLRRHDVPGVRQALGEHARPASGPDTARSSRSIRTSVIPRTSRCGRRPGRIAPCSGRAPGARASPGGTSSARRCR